MEFETVVGMEVHVELNSRSKVFCSCSTNFHAPPNTNVCPVCLGMPGAMPVLNRDMVEKSAAVGLALNCSLSRWSKMDRKNYFYPDLPKNYQISQYDLPLCSNGWLDIELDSGISRRIGITRAHMEEDTARNTHEIGGGLSGVDFNRSGVPLLEIVSEPDLRSAEEAYVFLSALKQILQYLDVSDCNMEEGSLRAEANISVRPQGTRTFGTKTEVKNVASFSGVMKAIEFEVARQIAVIRDHGTVIQETRGWDAERGITYSQRQKESAHDYRYFPEPDLVPMALDEAWEAEIRGRLPELPQARRARLQQQYQLSAYDAAQCTLTRGVADYFEAVAETGVDPKKVANWMMGDLQALLVEAKEDIATSKVPPENLAAMIALIDDATISGKIAKEVLAAMFNSGKTPKEIIEAQGLVQISDTAELERIVREVIAASPEQAAQFRAGKEKVIGYLVGQVMKLSAGKANPQRVNEILRKSLQQQEV